MFFALPSRFANGPGGVGPAVTIRTVAEARLANESLPCGAKLQSVGRSGPYITGTFQLTGRPGPGGSDCGQGAGGTARVNFQIANGRIVVWQRAPDPRGSGSPQGPSI
jgi:hypothetical protein